MQAKSFPYKVLDINSSYCGALGKKGHTHFLKVPAAAVTLGNIKSESPTSSIKS